MMTPDDIADDLGVARRTAILYMQQMPRIRVGKSPRVERNDYEEWKRKRRVG